MPDIRYIYAKVLMNFDDELYDHAKSFALVHNPSYFNWCCEVIDNPWWQAQPLDTRVRYSQKFPAMYYFYCLTYDEP